MPNNEPADKNNSGNKYIAKSELERLFSVFGSLTKDAQTTKALPVSDPIGDDSPVLTISSLA